MEKSQDFIDKVRSGELSAKDLEQRDKAVTLEALISFLESVDWNDGTDYLFQALSNRISELETTRDFHTLVDRLAKADLKIFELSDRLEKASQDLSVHRSL